VVHGVNLVNPHDVMFVNSDMPDEIVQGITHSFPIERPPANEIYRAQWDFHLPVTRHQPLDAPGRPPAHRQYQLSEDILVGQWPDEDRRWRVLQKLLLKLHPQLRQACGLSARRT
jgi:hypothetical protein